MRAQASAESAGRPQGLLGPVVVPQDRLFILMRASSRDTDGVTDGRVSEWGSASTACVLHRPSQGCGGPAGGKGVRLVGARGGAGHGLPGTGWRAVPAVPHVPAGVPAVAGECGRWADGVGGRVDGGYGGCGKCGGARVFNLFTCLLVHRSHLEICATFWKRILQLQRRGDAVVRLYCWRVGLSTTITRVSSV